MDLERITLNNEYYRKVIYTDNNIQLVLMSLLVGEDIHMEVHDGTQFIRVEKGLIYVLLDDVEYEIGDGQSIIVPPHTHHYVKNIYHDETKLYTIYSPPEHSKTRLEYTNKLGDRVIIRK